MSSFSKKKLAPDNLEQKCGAKTPMLYMQGKFLFFFKLMIRFYILSFCFFFLLARCSWIQPQCNHLRNARCKLWGPYMVVCVFVSWLSFWLIPNEPNLSCPPWNDSLPIALILLILGLQRSIWFTHLWRCCLNNRFNLFQNWFCCYSIFCEANLFPICDSPI